MRLFCIFSRRPWSNISIYDHGGVQIPLYAVTTGEYIASTSILYYYTYYIYADDGIDCGGIIIHHYIEIVFITHILYLRRTFAEPSSSVLRDLAVAGDKAEQLGCRRLLLYS